MKSVQTLFQWPKERNNPKDIAEELRKDRWVDMFWKGNDVTERRNAWDLLRHK